MSAVYRAATRGVGRRAKATGRRVAPRSPELVARMKIGGFDARAIRNVVSPFIVRTPPSGEIDPGEAQRSAS
jgi:hypothetical protein